MTREEFAAAVRRMTEVEGATVKVEDFYNTGHSVPYRYATLALRCDEDATKHRAVEIVALAIDVRGYMNMHVYDDRTCELGISLSRDLDEDQMREPSSAVLPVSMADVIGGVS